MILERFPISRNLVFFMISLVLALALPALGYVGGLGFEGRKTLFILVLAIGLWVSEAIPAFAVSLLIVGFQIFFLGSSDVMGGDLALEKYTRAWASPVIWLLMGGFFLSLSLTLTKIDRMVSQVAIRQFGVTSYQFLLGMMVTTAVLSMFISNTASTALMVAILLPMLSHADQPEAIRRSLLVGIPAAASIGGMGTLIGSTPNAIAHSHLASLGVQLEFLSWAKFGLPVAAVLLFVVWGLVIFLFRPPPQIFLLPVEVAVEDRGAVESGRLLRRHQRIALGTFIGTLILWVSAPLHTLSVSVVSFVPIVVLTVTGVVKSADIRALPWDTLLLIMGGISLGDSVVESGLASFLISKIDIVGRHPVLIMMMFGYISVLFSNFMSNTAAAAILIPMASGLVAGYELPVTLTIALSASMATALPVSTPPNAISYATGYIYARDFVQPGLALAIMGPPLVVAVLYFWIP